MGTATASINSSLTTMGTATASINASLTTMGTATASINSSLTTMGTATASINASLTTMGTATASLNSATGSINSSLTAVGVVTASLVQTQSLLNQHIATLGELTESLNASLVELGGATASIDISLADLGNATASLNSATASLQLLITLAEQNMFRHWVTGSLNQLKQSTNERGMYYGTSYYNNEPLNLIFDTGPVDISIPDDGDGYADSLIYHFHSPDSTTGSIRINGNDFEGDVEVAFNDPSGSHHRELFRAGTDPTVNGPLFFNGNNNQIYSASAGILNFGETTATSRNVNLDNNIWEFNDVAIKAGLNELHIWSDGSGDGNNPRLRRVALFRHGEPGDGSIVMNPTPAGEGLYMGQSHLGYYSGGDWQSYLSSSGDFRLGNSQVGQSSGSFEWNNRKGELKIVGDLSIGAGFGGLDGGAAGLTLDFGGPSGSATAPTLTLMAQSESQASTIGRTKWVYTSGSRDLALGTGPGGSGQTNDAVNTISGFQMRVHKGQMNWANQSSRTDTWGTLRGLCSWKDTFQRSDGQTFEIDIDAFATFGGRWLGGYYGLQRDGYADLTPAERHNTLPWYSGGDGLTNTGTSLVPPGNVGGREAGWYWNGYVVYFAGSDQIHDGFTACPEFRYGATTANQNHLPHGVSYPNSVGGLVPSESGQNLYNAKYHYGSYFDKYKLSMTVLPGGGTDMRVYRYYRGTGCYQDGNGNSTTALPLSMSSIPIFQKTIGTAELQSINGGIGHATGSTLNMSIGSYYNSYSYTRANKITVSPAGVIGGTTISGDKITTGVIKSNNYTDNTGNGTLLDLNNGILEMRSNNAARFKLDSTNNTAVIAGWTFTSLGLTGNSEAYIRTAGTGKRIEINSADNNIKFYDASSNVLTIDDNVLASPAHPGLKIDNGVIRIINTSDFGSAGAGAPLFVSAQSATPGSNRCGAFFGISIANTLPNWWTNTPPTITGLRQPYQLNKCLGLSVATTAFHAGVVAEASNGACPANATAANTIFAAYLGSAEDGGFSFYGVEGIMYNAGEIRSAVDIVAYYSSDERMKDNIFIIEDPLDKIKRLRGVEFDWIKETAPQHIKDGQYLPNGSMHDIGVIAQDVQKVFPEAVTERDNGYLAVKYEKLVPVLIEGIKDQQKQIESLMARIDKLENK